MVVNYLCEKTIVITIIAITCIYERANSFFGLVDSIKWYISGMTIANPHSDTINACFLLSGNYQAKLYVFDSGVMDSAVQTVTIKPTPHPKILGLDSAYYAFGSCCSVVDSYLSYQWYEAEGPFLIIGATSNSLLCGMGNFYVVVDSGGCLGMSDTAIVPEGVKNIYYLNFSIKLTPNPTSSTLAITSTQPIDQVIISNLLGQNVFSSAFSQKEKVQVDVSELPSGMYFVTVNGSEVRRFIKE